MCAALTVAAVLIVKAAYAALALVLLWDARLAFAVRATQLRADATRLRTAFEVPTGRHRAHGLLTLRRTPRLDPHADTDVPLSDAPTLSLRRLETQP